MALEPGNIVIGKSGAVHVAPPGTTAPTTEASALDAAFVDLGLLTPAGVKRSSSVTELVTESWQLDYPARRDVQSRDSTWTLELQEWNPDAVIFALGGGTISANGAGHAKYVPPALGDRDPRSMVIDWVDGDKHYRCYIPQGAATEPGESTLSKATAAILPVGFKLEAVSGENPFTIFTDDPAWL